MLRHRPLVLPASAPNRPRPAASDRADAYFHLAAHAPDVVALLDPDGSVRWANPAAERLLGHAPDALTGQRLADLVHPDDTVRVDAARLERCDPDEVLRYRFRHADGSYRWVETLVAPLLGPDGMLEALLTTSRPGGAPRTVPSSREPAYLTSIAELQRRLAAGLDVDAVLGEGARRAEAVTGADGAVVALAEGEAFVVRAATGAAAGRLGTRLPLDAGPAARALAEDAVVRWPGDADDEPSGDGAAGDAAESSRSGLALPLRADGRTVGVLEVTCHRRPHAFTDEHARVFEVVGGVLGAALARRLAPPPNGPAAFWRADAVGRLAPPQPAWEAFTGQAPDDYLHFGWAEAIHPDDRSAAFAAWTHAAAVGEPFEAACRLWHAPSGAHVPVVLRARPDLDADGQATGWTGTLDGADGRSPDIPTAPEPADRVPDAAPSRPAARPEEGAAENAVRDALRAASAARAAAWREAADALRPAARSVAGMTDLLLATPLAAHQRDYAERAHAAAGTLRALADDLLVLSALADDAAPLAEALAAPLAEAPFDLPALVEDAAADAARAAQAKGVELAVDVADGAPRSVEGDAARLRTVLDRLLARAVAATAEGAVVVHLRPTRDGVRFEVRDTGRPLPDAPPGRTLETLLAAPEAGLGLAVGHALVRHLGGTLVAAPGEARGATLAFTLPLFADEPGAAPRPPAGGRVLVAEARPVTRRLLCERLARLGFDAEPAETGAAALARLVEGAPFDAAFVAADLPGIDGSALAAAVDGVAKARPRRFVLLTDLDGAPPAAPGVDGVLTRPVREAALRALLGAG